MLSSGRLDEASRDEAFRQLERAAGRLGDLAQQSSELAGWLEPHEGEEYHMVPVSAMVTRGAEAAAAAERVRIIGTPSATEYQVRTREPRALAAALAAVIDSTARELPMKHSEIGITINRSPRPNECDIIVGPPDVIGGIQIDNADGGSNKFNLETGGLGLHMILGAVVLEAHGASLWASSDVRGVTGVRIPVGTRN